MAKLTVFCPIGLVLIEFLCLSSCDDIKSVQKKRNSSVESDSRRIALRNDSLENKFDEVFWEMIRRSPRNALKAIDPMMEELQERLGNLSVARKVCGLLSKACLGRQSEEEQVKRELSMAHLYRTSALHEAGDNVMALIELKKTQKLLKYLKSEFLKTLPSIETKLVQRIKETFNKNPKALFGFDDEDFYKSDVKESYDKLVSEIDQLKRPNDPNLKYVRSILIIAYNRLSQEAN